MPRVHFTGNAGGDAATLRKIINAALILYFIYLLSILFRTIRTNRTEGKKGRKSAEFFVLVNVPIESCPLERQRAAKLAPGDPFPLAIGLFTEVEAAGEPEQRLLCCRVARPRCAPILHLELGRIRLVVLIELAPNP